MSNRLSHSSIKTYQECGKKWELHYRHKLREKIRSGALSFGTAIDRATEAVLKDRTVDEKSIFDKEFTHQDINGEMVYLPDSLLCVYASSDFDEDLITEEDAKFLEAKATELLPNLGSWRSTYNDVKSFKAQKSYRHFRAEENKFYNLCNWVCLRRKGHLMLDANRAKVLPKIREVLGTQVEIKLENGEGDSVVGFADAVLKWDKIEEDVVFDYKTSSRAYDEKAVTVSPQLTLYAQALGLTKAGFIVFKKQIIKNRTKVCSSCGENGTGSRAKTCDAQIKGKRCGATWIEKITPEVDVQILIDDIPQKMAEIVMENIEMTNRGIDAGIFTRNLESCEKPWGRCGYYEFCYKGKEDDLIKVEDKK